MTVSLLPGDTSTRAAAQSLPQKLDWFGRKAEHVWSWLPLGEMEEGTAAQVRNIGSLPNAVAVAVMPDAHKGYGMPIGTALATKGAVVPYAVGVDIGCGMVALELGIPAEDMRPLVRRILEGIYARVPVGQPDGKKDRNAGSHAVRQDSDLLREWAQEPTSLGLGVTELREKAERQLGTLGGGNHFIELQESESGEAWLMLHTGSRGFGHAIGTEFYKRAAKWCERYYTTLPDPELAFLSLDTEDGQAYMRQMHFAMKFAEESRDRIERACLETIFGADASWTYGYIRRVETHHNFAAAETHFGQKVIVHRKGAVRTVSCQGLPEAVTIPGSMQTGSYIGRGKPNKLAMDTCSHGAGRRLGRNAVMRENVGVDIRAEMTSQGIELVCPPGSNALDEAGRAYKDIESVMRYQTDLVTPAVKLRPLGVVKG